MSGAPGIGKTSLVNLIARTLIAHPAAIEDLNGREVSLNTVRESLRGLPYRSLFGGWTVKVVNEFDRCSRDAQDLLLTMLDRMPPGHAILARRWHVPIATTRMIAAGAAGKVRAAMADLEMWLG